MCVCVCVCVFVCICLFLNACAFVCVCMLFKIDIVKLIVIYKGVEKWFSAGFSRVYWMACFHYSHPVVDPLTILSRSFVGQSVIQCWSKRKLENLQTQVRFFFLWSNQTIFLCWFDPTQTFQLYICYTAFTVSV